MAEMSTLTIDVVAKMWRDHANCNWLSDGVNVRWSCGIIHPGAIHMQPTTRDRHLAALVVTQVEAERAMERSGVLASILAAAKSRRAPTTPADPERAASTEGSDA